LFCLSNCYSNIFFLERKIKVRPNSEPGIESEDGTSFTSSCEKLFIPFSQ